MKRFRQTEDGYGMPAHVWKMSDSDDGSQQWTWGFVPASGSKYLSTPKGIWSSFAAAKTAMEKSTLVEERGEV